MTLTSPAQTAAVQFLPLAKDLDENKVTPGVLGFIVFAVMGAAVWMLMKSMHRHMNKVDFEERPEAGSGARGEQGTAADVPAQQPEPAPEDSKPSGPGA
jgi:hypothetical protein